MLFSTLLSLAIALVMRNDIDILASFVNFGALSAFLLLHVSVLVHMAWRKRSKQYFVHWCVPILGIVVVLAVFSGMAPAALKVGGVWLVIGVVYGLFLRSRKRTELSV
jgi:amino acid transporter